MYTIKGFWNYATVSGKFALFFWVNYVPKILNYANSAILQNTNL